MDSLFAASVGLEPDREPAKYSTSAGPRHQVVPSWTTAQGRRSHASSSAHAIIARLTTGESPVLSCTGIALKSDPRDKGPEARTPLIRVTRYAHRDPALKARGCHSRSAVNAGASGMDALQRVTSSTMTSRIELRENCRSYWQHRQSWYFSPEVRQPVQLLASIMSVLEIFRRLEIGPSPATSLHPRTSGKSPGSATEAILVKSVSTLTFHASSMTPGARRWVGEAPRFRWAISSATMLMAISGTV